MKEKLSFFFSNVLQTIEENGSETTNSSSGDLSDAGKLVEQLFPSLIIMATTFGAVVVLAIILNFFLYKPVSNMVKKRQEFIQKNIDDSIEAKKTSLEINLKSYEELTQSRLLASNIIKDAKIELNREKTKNIEKSQKEIKKMFLDAENEIQNLRLKFEEEKKEEIINTAIEISKKIIEENINPKIAEKYYKELIEKG